MRNLVRSAPVTPRGSLWHRLLIGGALVAALVYTRLVIYPTAVVPLTDALPLLYCIWCRDRRLLWGMTAVLLGAMAIKVLLLLPPRQPDQPTHLLFAAMQTFNIVVVAAVIHGVILLMSRLEASITVLEQTNAELEASNEELAAREEEITQQNEELQSQAEELEQHTEELNAQAEELQTINEHLAARERTLHDLLETSATGPDERELLARIGDMIVRLLGDRARGAAVIEPDADRATVHPLFGVAPSPSWLRRESTVASLAVARDRAAFLPELSLRPDLQTPHLSGGGGATNDGAAGHAPRSILAAPLRSGDSPGAALEIYSDEPGDWSEEDLRMAQWLAEQCGRLWSNARLRADLGAQRDLLRTVTDHATAALVMSDHSGRCTYMNPAAERLTGLAASEAAGRPLHDIFHAGPGPDAHLRDACPLHSEPTRISLGREDTIVQRSTGERIPTLFSAIPIARDGRLIATVLEVRDVRDDRRAQREREELLESERSARAEAERASRAKDEFVATLSHELRTPLNAILGWSAILGADQAGEKGADPADLAQGLQVIERNARHQAQLISDLLDISRITAGKIRLEVQHVDLSAVIDAAVATIRPAAEAKGVSLDAAIEPVDRIVMGDPDRLQQVAWNLLTNAIKFTPRGGHVRVSLSRVASYVQFTVADTGQGIEPALLPHLFERYRQGDASAATRRHGGLGLGLAIVKHLIELHGGSVHARSDGPDTGASFSVLLPVLAVNNDGALPHHALPGAASLPEPQSPALSGLRVLVVDDEPDARDLISRVLQDRGVEVVTTASATEALAALAPARPHLIISDIGMPGMDGYTLIRRIRAGDAPGYQAIPAVALTAFARAEDRARALHAGFQSHISKPVEPRELVATIAGLAAVRRPPGDHS